MPVIIGIAGARRNAAAALCDDGRVVAVCEQERLTRTRRTGLRRGELPLESVDAVLRIGAHRTAEVSEYAVAEAAIELPAGLPIERVDHHHAHAATAFYTSSFQDAVVLVCDRHGAPELTVWRGDGGSLARLDHPWNGPAFASVYSGAARAFGFTADRDEHRLESLAHGAGHAEDSSLSLVAYHGDRLDLPPDLTAVVADLLTSTDGRAVANRAAVADRIQRHVGQLLLSLVRDVKAAFGGRHLCLGGGLFYNSYFNTLLARSGLYERTFVPANPGNAGVAIGAALAVAGKAHALVRTTPLSPFLGPQYDTHEIKATLDNCKLSYDYLSDGPMIERTAAVLQQGKLVGWLQGRMEWGPRALGHRSILASPVAPFVLENLNVFLKHREPYRSYGVAVCAEDVSEYFDGPPSSEFMEHEYDVIRPDVLRALLPPGVSKLRVQTVSESAGAFHRLIRAFGQLTGVPILVNTSFNGFNEPIVCTPRDAIRVFYGTGLDMAVIGGFIVEK